MSPSLIPSPEPLALPAPVWLLSSLLLLTFVLHVIAMNVLLGGSLLAVHARLRHSANVHARTLLASFARFAPVLITATVTLGVAPLLFLQVLYGRVFFVSSILMAWWWLAIVPALILAYVAAYRRAFQATTGPQTSLWPHLVIASLLLGIAFVYTSNMTLMLRVADFQNFFRAGAGGFRLNVADPTFWPRWLHMVLGATAVASLGVAIVGIARKTTQPDFSAWACRYGASWSVAATAANLAVGVWWLSALPAVIRSTLFGFTLEGGLLAASALAGLAALALLVQLRRRPSSALVAGSAAAMLVSVVGMVLVRDALRRLALETAGFAATRWIVPQWVPIALFAGFLVVAVAIVGWMTVALRRAAATATEHGWRSAS